MSSNPKALSGTRAARHFWETADPPPLTPPSAELVGDVAALLTERWPELIGAPFAPRPEIETRTLARLATLLEQAGRFPIYAARLAEAGIRPGTSVDWTRFARIRPVTKAEMMSAFGSFAEREAASRRPFYRTRSSGSSGHTLDIVVDEPAVATDTAQAYRQLVLQSGLRFQRNDCVAHVYTVPWPVDEVGGQFVGHFISSLIAPDRIADILRELRPAALSLYPTSLESVIARGGLTARDLSAAVVITHSEQSTVWQRQRWSELLRVPVLDEYSSEEAARIALQLPCGHYHTCDDAVYVEVLDPESWEPQEPGRLGLVVVTNLLNEAMPFIRYVQGDLAIAGERPECPVQWGVLESVQGRRNDAFLNRHREVIAAGAILDATYRAMFENRLSIDFELVQSAPAEVALLHSCPDDKRVRPLRDTLLRALTQLFGHDVELSLVPAAPRPARGCGKSRPIRRTFASVQPLPSWRS